MNENQKKESTPLTNAVWKNDIDTIHKLLDNAEQDDKDYALYLAARREFNSIMTILLENGANVDHTRNYHPFFEVARSGNIEGAKILIKHGFNVNARNGKILLVAVEEGQTDMVELLLDNGANIMHDLTIVTAAKKNHLEIMKIFIKHKINIDANAGFALSKACRLGHYQMASLLLDNGANAQGHEGCNNPIYLANKHGHTAVVSVLKEYGADLNNINLSIIKKLNATRMYKGLKSLQKTLSSKHASIHEAQKTITNITESIENHIPEVHNQPRKTNLKFDKFLVNLNNVEDNNNNNKPKI